MLVRTSHVVVVHWARCGKSGDGALGQMWRVRCTGPDVVSQVHWARCGESGGGESDTHRAVEDGAVSVAKALDVRCQVQADGAVPDGVHRLRVEEVMGPRCNTRHHRVSAFAGGLKG